MTTIPNLFVESNYASHANNPIAFAPYFRLVLGHNSTVYRCCTIYKHWVACAICKSAQLGAWAVVNEGL
jgi:hypothetical protein